MKLPEYHLAIIYMLEFVVGAREPAGEQESHQPKFFVRSNEGPHLYCAAKKEIH
jgi:hypothetical protein